MSGVVLVAHKRGVGYGLDGHFEGIVRKATRRASFDHPHHSGGFHFRLFALGRCGWGIGPDLWSLDGYPFSPAKADGPVTRKFQRKDR
jgi:hypothetical protein